MAKFGRNGVGPAKPEKPSALERVQALEDFREEVLRAVRETFAVVETRLQGLEEVSEAVINKVGRSEIEAEIRRLHIERLEKRAEQETVAFESALKSGRIAPAETIGDMSVVIGSEVDKDGNKLYPSRVQLVFATLKDEYKEKIRGVKAGEVVETPFGSKFTIAAVYDIVPPKDQSPTAEAHPAETLPAPLPPGDEPLTPEAEEALVAELEAVSEKVKADATETEAALVEDLVVAEKA